MNVSLNQKAVEDVEEPIAGSENHPFDLFIKCQKLISFKRQNILSYGF